MKKVFYVTVKEIHDSIHEVEATSKEEAILLVKDGAGTEVNLEYNHTLDPETWSVDENPY